MDSKKAKEILKKYKKDKALFNWCEEYKQFINDGVGICLTAEINYILKKSYEDGEAPLSYEDLDLFDCDNAREHLLYKYDDDDEKLKEYANDKKTYNRKVKNKGDFEVFLKSLNKEELKGLFYDLDFDVGEVENPPYEWWYITDPLKYQLEQQNEIILDGYYWGRRTTGQHISLDYCCIKAFINWLEGWL